MRLSVWLSWIVPHVWVSPSFNWTHAVDEDDVALERLMTFNHSVGLPVTLAQLDITTPEQVNALVDRAATMKEWTCVPYEMTKDKFRNGIYKVDELGRKFVAKQS